MGKLIGSVVKRELLVQEDIERMYQLMDTFYDNMNWEHFLRDLGQKDYCIVLRDESGKIWGFSTQVILKIPVDEKIVHGVFSGDTIIHKDYWGSMALFIAFSNFFFEFEKTYGDFYWFLICKGYKTYKLLPTFFKTFYPCYNETTPESIKAIMDAYGKACYEKEYNPKTGVVHYQSIKDRLKENVADITEDRLKDPHIAFFASSNPGYIQGDDLVCLTQLSKDNLYPSASKFLFQS